MRCDHVKVPVTVHHFEIEPQSHGSDLAVDQTADGVSRTTATSMDGRGVLRIPQWSQRFDIKPLQESSTHGGHFFVGSSDQ